MCVCILLKNACYNLECAVKGSCSCKYRFNDLNIMKRNVNMDLFCFRYIEENAERKSRKR